MSPLLNEAPRGRLLRAGGPRWLPPAWPAGGAAQATR